MKSITPVKSAVPTTLPLHEHNARRHRARVVPTPGKANQPHRTSDVHSASDAAAVLSTYSQFPGQGPLHE